MIPFPVDKVAVARNFSRAADGYEGWARAQGEIASTLAALLPPGFVPALAVDVGCGTGLLSEALLSRFPGAPLVGVDLAEGMVEACRLRFAPFPRARFVAADAEGDPLPATGHDLVAGSCVAQWFADPARSLSRWGASLPPGGILAFSFLLEGSFPELARAHREALGSDFRGLGLFPRSFGPAVARGAGLRLLRCEEAAVTASYGSAREALRSFRGIGASFDGHPGHRPLPPPALRRLLACYGDGEPAVTHRVQYVVAERNP